LTAAGKRLIDNAIQLRLDAADDGLQSIDKKEQARLADLLRKVCLTSERN
jgi:DNA-binding MarR family transcriptional regulator